MPQYGILNVEAMESVSNQLSLLQGAKGFPLSVMYGMYIYLLIDMCVFLAQSEIVYKVWKETLYLHARAHIFCYNWLLEVHCPSLYPKQQP